MKVIKSFELLKNKRALITQGLLITLILISGIYYFKVYKKLPPTFKESTNSDFSYEAQNSVFITKVGQKETNKPVIEFATKNGSKASIELLDTEYNLDKPNQKRNEITFSNSMPNIDIQYKTLINGLKEEIILKEKQTILANKPTNEFVFSMKLENANPKQIANNIMSPTFFDNDNEYAFHFEKPFALDSTGTRTEDISMQILSSDEKGVYQIKYILDLNWLNSEERKYPIIIDPTIVHDTSSEFAQGTMDKIIDTGSGASPVLSTNYPEATVDKNTVGIWHLNETVMNSCTGGSNDSCDYSGNGYDGAWNGNTTTTTGKVNGGVVFDGTNDNINIADNDNFSVSKTGQLTVMGWVKVTATATEQHFVTKKATGNLEWTLKMNSDGTPRAIVYNTLGATYLGDSSGPVLTAGDWYHLAFVIDNTATTPFLKFYVNGVVTSESITPTGTLAANGTAALIFGEDGDAANDLNGSLDEIVISNTARTEQEIKIAASKSQYGVYTSPVIDLGERITNWNNISWTENGVKTGDGETLSSTTSLIAQWNFNSTSGTTASNDAGASTCGGTGSNCNFTLTSFAAAANGSQDGDVYPSGWTANNKRWGAGAIMLHSLATADSLSRTDPASNILDPNSADMTLETWVFTNDISSEIFSNNNANGTACTNNGYYLGIDSNGYPVFHLDTNGATAGCDGQINTANKKINDGKWHLLTVTITRGSSAVMYMDGVQIGIDTSITSYSAITVTGTVYMGGSAGGFDGIFDSTRLYTRALGSNEVISNYNTSNIELLTRVGNSINANDGSWETWKPTTSETQLDSMDGYLYNTSDANLVSYWPMDETTDNSCSGGEDTCDAKATNQLTDSGGSIIYDGKFGKARYFDGVNDYLNQNYDADFNFGTGSFTTEGWFLNKGNGYIATSTIKHNSDDAEETATGGTTDISSTDLEYVNDTVDQQVGLRFKNLDIPQGATITSAYIEFKADETQSEATSLTFYAEDVDNSAVFAASTNNLTGRTKTTNSAAWNTLGTWTTDYKYKSADISSPIQEVISRAGWTKGNALTLIATGTGHRTADSFNKTLAEPAKLIVSYTSGTSGTLINRYDTDQGFKVINNTNGTLTFGIDDDATWGPDDSASSTISYADGKWHHFAAVKNGTTGIYLYVDGQLVGSDVAIAATGTLTSDSAPIRLGESYNGYLDEIRIYNTNLSATTIQGKQAEGSSDARAIQSNKDTILKMEGTASAKNTTGIDQLDPTVVGMWRFDDTNGDNAGVDIFDESNYSNDGEIVGSNLATAIVDGISGKARYFSGSPDYVNIDGVAPELNNSISVSAWFNSTNTGTGNIFAINTTAGGNIFQLRMETNKVAIMDNVGNTTINDGKWHYLVAQTNGFLTTVYVDGKFDSAYDVTTTAVGDTDLVSIGQEYDAGPTATDFIVGNIDEVVVRNTIMSPEKIAKIYQLAKGEAINKTLSNVDMTSTSTIPFYIAADRPGTYLEANVGESAFANYQTDDNTVGLWHFEENESTDYFIKDSSGNDHNGYSIRSDYSDGVIGGGRSFKRSDSEKISVPDHSELDITSAITLSAWVKYNSQTSWDKIISKRDGAVRSYDLGRQSPEGKYYFSLDGVGNAASQSDIINGEWAHVVGTWDGATIKIYVNGVMERSEAVTGTINTTAADLTFGATGDGATTYYLDGSIDEVRIDNIARSASEIRQAYENGLRSHPITIDFAAKLASTNLITSSTDFTFNIDATRYGLTKKGSKLYEGDKIIIKETVNGTTYTAQGTVTTIGLTDGVTTVVGWDSASTFPSSGYTINAQVFKWQREYMDISNTTTATRNSINSLSVRITDNNEGRTFWLDDLKTNSGYHTSPSGNTIASAVNNRYMQYKSIISSGTRNSSANLSNITIDYTTKSPALMWKLDENNGTTAYDHSQNTLNGTISGATWIGNGQCANKACLNFDGSNDYITKSDNSTLDFAVTDSFTLEGWFKHQLQSSGQDILLAKYETAVADGGYKVLMEADGDITVGMDTDDTSFPQDSVTSTAATYDDNNWHHFAAVKNSTTSLSLYIDGKLVGTDSTLASTGTYENNDAFYVGIDGDGTSNAWLGSIDNIKIFRYARNVSEIKTDYTNMSTMRGTSASFGPDDKFMSDGLVSYWNMDENAVNTCPTVGADTCDKSGNLVEGAWVGNTTFATGKYGNSVTFDGTGDYIDLGSPTVLDNMGAITTSAWIYPNADSGRVIDKQTNTNTGGWQIELKASGTHVQFVVDYDGAADLQVEPNTSLTANTWYHIAIAWDGTANASGVKIYINGVLQTSFTNNISGIGNRVDDAAQSVGLGCRVQDGNQCMIGRIDDFRLYNRYLTPTEVNKLYSWAPGPVGYWKLDENTGTTGVDSSGNGFNLTTLGNTIWSSGKYGSAVGLNTDGTTTGLFYDDTSTATTDLLDFSNTQNFSYTFWYKSSAAENTSVVPFYKGATSTSTIGYNWEISSANDAKCKYTDGNASGDDRTSATLNIWNDGNWHHIGCVMDRTSGIFTMYVDGVISGTDIALTEGSAAASDIDLKIGEGAGASFESAGGVDEVKIYSYARTPSQIIEDMNGGHPTPGSPVGSTVGEWHLDEGYDTTANDSSSHTNSLTLSAASWTNSGKYAKGWNGDGAKWLSKTDSPDFDFAAGADFTVSTWFKSDSTTNPSANEYIVSKEATSAGYAIWATATNAEIVCGIDDDATSFPEDSAGDTAANTDYYDQAWHHIACVRDTANGKLNLYIDGILVNADTTLSATGSLENTDTLTFGSRDTTDNTDDLNGDLDEIKIYRAALNIDQIKVLLNQGKASMMGAPSTDTTGIADFSNSRTYCIPGDTATCNPPTGEWKLDENTGVNGASVKDTSGNGYSGNITGYVSDFWQPCKFGSCLKTTNADATQTRIDSIGDINALDFSNAQDYTVSMWTKHIAMENSVYILYYKGAHSDSAPGYNLSVTSTQKYRCNYADTDAGAMDTATSTTSADGNWHFVACVMDRNGSEVGTAGLHVFVDGVLEGSDTTFDEGDGSGSTSTISIGETDSAYEYTAYLDEVKVFSYARTQPQLAWDFNRGDPIAYWKFDECADATTYDSSGNGLNGTIYPGTTGNTATGRCGSGTSTEMWNDGTTGKYGSSLGFDGTSDYVSVADSNKLEPEKITVSAWVYPTSQADFDRIIQKHVSGSEIGWGLRVRTNERPGAWYYKANGTLTRVYAAGNVMPNNQWTNVAFTFDGTTMKMYINGAEIPTVTDDDTPGSTNTGLTIGGRSATQNRFTGQIDDVRVYNHVLTQQQINIAISQGAAVSFGQ